MANKPNRITIKELFDYLLDLVNFEKGIPFATKELLLRPKQSLDKYFYENRYYLVNPLRFMVLTATVLLVLTLADKEGFINKSFQTFEDTFKEEMDPQKIEEERANDPAYNFGKNLGKTIAGNKKQKEKDTIAQSIEKKNVDSLTTDSLQVESKDGAAISEKRLEVMNKFSASYKELFSKYSNLVSFLSIPVIGFISWLLYRNKKYNFAEHMVIWCFYFAVYSCLLIIPALIDALVKAPLNLSTFLALILGPVLMYYFLKKLYLENAGTTILKTFVVYSIQQTASIVFMMGILIISFIIKLMAG